MSERFDDIIRKQLEGLESPVPPDMFDQIRNHPDVSDAMFDGGIKNTLHSLENAVAIDLFNTINAETDLTNASFDGGIEHKLSSFESAVPADMWERITERKRRRRPVAWWWVAAGLLLMIAGGTWYATHDKVVRKPSSDNIVLAGEKQVSNKDAVSPKNAVPSHKFKHPVLLDTLLQHEDYLQKPQITKKEITATNPLFENNKNVNPNYKTRHVNESRLDKMITANSNNDRKQKSKHYQAEKNSTNISDTEDETEVNVKSGLTKDNTATESFASVMSTVKLAMMQQLRNAARLAPGQLLKAKPHSPVIPCPVNRDDDRNEWYADIYASAFLFNKKVSDKEAAKNVGKGFDSTLHRQVSFNAGISLVKNMGEHVLLKTGIQYNRLNESFRLTRINERKLVTTISVRTVIISPGDTVYIRDTSVTEKIGTIQRRRQNTCQQWDVPVIIGYEFGGENIRLNANAGIIANIRSSYSGNLLDTLQQVIDAKNYNGKSLYKTNVGFSIYAGLSIVKPLGERTSLLIEPYARIGLSNTTTDNAWFKQKNSAAGISVGLRYKLNGGQRR